jgi:uncharacterized protein
MAVSVRPSLQPTDRTRLRRAPRRGSHDFATIAAILDEGLVCHLGLAAAGQPVVVPLNYGRQGRELFVHGSPDSRVFRALAEGAVFCCAVTLLDGLVLARSAYHHAINYRSVILYGKARRVGQARKPEALRAISEHLLPGRWAEVRPPSRSELDATLVLSLPIREGSAKVRTGPPADDPTDRHLACWAGVVPLSVRADQPVPDGHVAAGVQLPEGIGRYLPGPAT